MNLLTKFKDQTIEALKDNKKLILGLYILFIVCFVAAWFLSASRMAAVLSNIQHLNINVGPSDMNSKISAVELFIHNEIGGIVTYATSVLFGIPAVLLLIYNGVNLGMMGQLFATMMPNGGLKYIVYLIPHGIFEITATVIVSAAGILLFRFIRKFIKAWRSDETHGVSDAFEKTKKILIQSLILLIFSTILLIIAAPIEAYVSVPLSELVLGF
ncbi:MAG: hypothetical protein BZ138_02600 [Methanosphaera sp. rholeuAM270]|nr:MAG: hypothetical protein BZ138_02600 [Methanosphaera sp. rholeuAM270]